ncbi:uncharacterized protein Mask isoform X2 [Polyergus mexicanus]|uniref:uncharacterized protein Mask isoform X2 n=1 Tax=Polyergus mexicanus TaxID=615972 RepID=UPI0038B58C2B
MQNVVQGTTSDSQKSHEKQSAAAAPAPSAAAATSVHYETGKTSSTPQSSNSSPTKSETETFSELQPRFMTDSSESEEDSVSEDDIYSLEKYGKPGILRDFFFYQKKIGRFS